MVKRLEGYIEVVWIDEKETKQRSEIVKAETDEEAIEVLKSNGVYDFPEYIRFEYVTYYS